VTQPPSFLERLTLDADDTVLIEHVARYRWVRPLVTARQNWIELGCGSGLGASFAADGLRVEKLVLVDIDEQALAEARSRLAPVAGEIVTLCVDLSDAADVRGLEEQLRGIDDAVVTCFETIEHLASFGPLIEMLARLVAGQTTCCVLSVPNDAFFGTENPHHLTKWGEERFEELVALLPEVEFVARQVQLAGSAVITDRDQLAAMPQPEFTERGASRTATHFLAGFGNFPAAPADGAAVGLTDQLRRRAWERQREADLEYFRARVAELERAAASIETDASASGSRRAG
jgi:SAM-dependent methyltransferase